MLVYMRNQSILGTVTKDHTWSLHSHTDQWENLFQCVGYNLVSCFGAVRAWL